MQLHPIRPKTVLYTHERSGNVQWGNFSLHANMIAVNEGEKKAASTPERERKTHGNWLAHAGLIRIKPITQQQCATRSGPNQDKQRRDGCWCMGTTRPERCCRNNGDSRTVRKTKRARGAGCASNSPPSCSEDERVFRETLLATQENAAALVGALSAITVW